MSNNYIVHLKKVFLPKCLCFYILSKYEKKINILHKSIHKYINFTVDLFHSKMYLMIKYDFEIIVQIYLF